MIQFKEKLTQHLRKFSTNPYLFIGSGLSRRYYNLPTWIQLLKDFFPNLHNNIDFNYYLSKSNRDPAKLATLMASEFHEVWWKHPSFEKSRKENGDKIDIQELPFKIELAEFVNRNGKVLQGYDEELSLLGKVVVDGIITTNWDDFLTKVFPDFKIYIGQQQLLFSESISIGEIYKIHGCCSVPKSLILTEQDYANFNARNAYLAAKLLTIFVEHPIIFLGYSISDPNVNEIILSIVKCLDNENLDKLKDRLLFVEWDPKSTDPTFEDGRLFQTGSNPLPIKHIKLDAFTPLFEVLSLLNRKYPVKVLRKLKESIVEIVKTNKPSKNLLVGDIDELGDDSQVEFVVGIGAVQNALKGQGYVGLDANDIIEDVIFNNREFDPVAIINSVMPKIGKGNSYIPVCKYFREMGYYSSKGTLTAAGLDMIKIGGFTYRGDKMPDCFLPGSSYANHKSKVNAKYKALSNLIADPDLDTAHKLMYIPLLDKKKIDLEILQTFLQNNIIKTGPNVSNFRKVVCLYDYYKNMIELK